MKDIKLNHKKIIEMFGNDWNIIRRKFGDDFDNIEKGLERWINRLGLEKNKMVRTRLNRPKY